MIRERERNREKKREKRERERRAQSPVGPSADSLCHPGVTTTNLSYRFPIFETFATALCGTTGKFIRVNIWVCMQRKSNCEHSLNGTGRCEFAQHGFTYYSSRARASWVMEVSAGKAVKKGAGWHGR